MKIIPLQMHCTSLWMYQNEWNFVLKGELLFIYLNFWILLNPSLDTKQVQTLQTVRVTMVDQVEMVEVEVEMVEVDVEMEAIANKIKIDKSGIFGESHSVFDE